MSSPRERRHGMVDPDLMGLIRQDIPSRRLDQQRQMKFFVVPGGRRLTEYEVLTMYAQQGTDWASGGLEIGDSMQKWPGGRPTYAPETTELKTTDWWRFRDPEGKWFFPSVKNKAEEGRINHRFLLSYSADGAIRTMDSNWATEILDRYYGAWAFSEYGLFNAHASSVHDCMSDIIRVFLSNIAFDKSDVAQLVQTQRVFMHKLLPELSASMDRPREVWTSSPIYRGARSVVEALWADCYDHLESIWAIHAIYDPLFGQYVRREFFQQMAPHYGDTLTPWFTAQAIGFHHYAAKGVRALFFDALVGDPEFADLNRRWLQVWTGKWLPRVLDALGDFLTIYNLVIPIPQVTDERGIHSAVAQVIDDWVQDFAKPLSYQADVDRLCSQVLDRRPRL